jgi:hypothetical protein
MYIPNNRALDLQPWPRPREGKPLWDGRRTLRIRGNRVKRVTTKPTR